MIEGFPNLNQQKSCEAMWDVFEQSSNILDDNSLEKDERPNRWLTIEKGTKLFMVVITFVVVLGGSIISKGALLFISSQLSQERKPYCNGTIAVKPESGIILPQEERVAWTWVLFFIYCVPQLATFLRSLRIVLFKHWTMPSIAEFLSVFLSESLSAIGNATFVLYVLPRMDSVKGCIVMNCLSLVPALLTCSSGLIEHYSQGKSHHFSKTVYLDMLCIAFQGVGLIFLTILQDGSLIWCLPVSAILISIGWWENYINGEINRFSAGRAITISIRTFPNSRYFTYSIISLWKCALFVGVLLLIEWLQYDKVGHLFSEFAVAFSDHDILKNVALDTSHKILIKNNYITPVAMSIIGVVSAYFAYIFGKFACKINIQRISYATPLLLSGPTTIIGLVSMCAVYRNNSCEYENTIPSYLFFNLPPQYELNDLWLLFAWSLLLLSHVLMTIHIWNPEEEILSSSEKLYVRPFYEPFLIDQDLGMNRKRFVKTNSEKKNEDSFTINRDSTVPMLYVCGTMWHETIDEMITFLKSIMVLDEDHCCRRIARNYLNSENTSYYELETHIIFDDAFISTSRNNQEPQINDFVKNLITCVEDVASMVHKVDIKLKPPVKYSTPYGGRLEWILPGKTKLVAHLKHNDKIRAKKRWSQVMYMSYILGYRIAERDDIDERQKEMLFQNTYILAVDGDIHFRPQAIHILLEHMQKDRSLAAACGRVHPIGSGVFAWYQKFEYAISHWMYKASENITGCVLCCPGCFTIFKASAIRSVLKTLTTKSTKALHFIKFDNGEDRWISTLLVQCGYKVGYVASSDAYTNCPEGIKELFNQRRRWIPSTTVNVIDLLSRTNTVRKVNDNISFLYMAYQSCFNILTLIGPSLILWMVVNICTFIFNISHWLSMLVNIVPVLAYGTICTYVSNENIQIQVAAILCGIYTPIMCCFFVNGLFEVFTNGLFSPWSLFFGIFLIQMFIVGLLHPKEIGYLKYIVIYYIMIPTMHLTLFIYSIFNMHKVSWGTREVNKPGSPDTTCANSWLEDESLKQANKRSLTDVEYQFWTNLIYTYLHPDDDTKVKNKITEDLKEFRDKALSTLLILNIMFISLMFLLTSKKVTIKWTFIDANEVMESELFNTILAVGVFSLFIIQIVAVFIHRFGTFSQIMSYTKLQTKKSDIKTDYVKIVRKMNRNCYYRANMSHIKSDSYCGNLDLEEMFLNSTPNGDDGFRNGYTNYGYSDISLV